MAATRPVEHCNALEIERLQARIAERLKKLARHADAAAQARVAADQSGWEARTDARCRARPGRGSLGSMLAQECFLDADADRLEVLDRMAAGKPPAAIGVMCEVARDDGGTPPERRRYSIDMVHGRTTERDAQGKDAGFAFDQTRIEPQRITALYTSPPGPGRLSNASLAVDLAAGTGQFDELDIVGEFPRTSVRLRGSCHIVPADMVAAPDNSGG